MIIHFTLPPFSPTLYSVLRNNLPDESGLVFLDSSDNELLWPTHISKKKFTVKRNNKKKFNNEISPLMIKRKKRVASFLKVFTHACECVVWDVY